MAGNTVLVEYGIQNEQSDLRAHVSVVTGMVYVFPTLAGQTAVATGRYRMVPVYTQGIVTARGYLVPPQAIEGCRKAPIPQQYKSSIRLTDGTSQKGDKAVVIVLQLLRVGMFPLIAQALPVHAKDLQVSGTDILFAMSGRVQVKCDYAGGEIKYGGTGNLFLQFAECNPFKQY